MSGMDATVYDVPQKDFMQPEFAGWIQMRHFLAVCLSGSKYPLKIITFTESILAMIAILLPISTPPVISTLHMLWDIIENVEWR